MGGRGVFLFFFFLSLFFPLVSKERGPRTGIGWDGIGYRFLGFKGYERTLRVKHGDCGARFGLEVG